MNVTKKSIALAVGGAFALSMAATTVSAAENPFAVKTLSSGYQVADNHAEKGAEGKCAEGKCAEGKCAAAEKKAHEGKCAEGKCAEGKCAANKKAHEGKCAEGKCAEGKCGK